MKSRQDDCVRNGISRSTYANIKQQALTCLLCVVAFAGLQNTAHADMSVRAQYYVNYIWGPPPYPLFASKEAACADHGGWMVSESRCRTNNWEYDVVTVADACPPNSAQALVNGTTVCRCNSGYSEVAGTMCVPGTTVSNPKSGGSPDSCSGQGGQPGVGRPIAAADGNKHRFEEDFRLGSLTFIRRFNALAPRALRVGARPNQAISARWRHDFERSIYYAPGMNPPTVLTFRHDGSVFTFKRISGVWTTDSDVVLKLESSVDGTGAVASWKLSDPKTGTVERYSAIGLLTQLTNRQGEVLNLDYSDSTQGPNGGVVLDVDGNPTSQTLLGGTLIRVRDQYGRAIQLGYDASWRLKKLTDPSGAAVIYRYQANGNLDNVAYPDGGRRWYYYNEQEHTGGTNQPLSLTGVSELVNGSQTVRIATYKYDPSGVAISTAISGALDQYTVTRTIPDQQTVVTDALGTQRIYTFSNINGRIVMTNQSQPGGAGCGPAASSMTYDANANVASRTDFIGVKACYAYDLNRNLETKRIEGLPAATDCATALNSPPSGDAIRTVTTQWHPDWRSEVKRSEPNKLITTIYNGQGATCAPADALVDGKPIAVVCSRTEQATTDSSGAAGLSATVTGPARTWNYTYNRFGQVLTANGPRTDVTDQTTYTYYDTTTANYTMGDLATITNPVGLVTRFTKYNKHGQVLESIDPTGLVTTQTYDLRQRLKTRLVGTELTTYDYDPVGNLIKVTQPDGSFLSYTYDAAHRLIGITDQKNNSISYTLDAMGNRVNEQVKDPSGQLVRNVTRVIDALNRVQQVTGAQ
jgi:YD repeat-containing protein